MTKALITMLISTLAVFAAPASYANDSRCTCYYTESDTVSTCKAFTMAECEVVYISAYNPTCSWASGDPDYWKNARQAADKNGKSLGAMISISPDYYPTIPDGSAIVDCIEKGSKANFKYVFVDIEGYNQKKACGDSPDELLTQLVSENTRVQYAVGNGTCEKAWQIPKDQQSLMCYDGAEGKEPCKTCSQQSRYMYKDTTGRCNPSDIYLPRG